VREPDLHGGDVLGGYRASVDAPVRFFLGGVDPPM